MGNENRDGKAHSGFGTKNYEHTRRYVSTCLCRRRKAVLRRIPLPVAKSGYTKPAVWRKHFAGAQTKWGHPTTVAPFNLSSRAWIRTMNTSSKGRCVTITPPGKNLYVVAHAHRAAAQVRQDRRGLPAALPPNPGRVSRRARPQIAVKLPPWRGRP